MQKEPHRPQVSHERRHRFDRITCCLSTKAHAATNALRRSEDLAVTPLLPLDWRARCCIASTGMCDVLLVPAADGGVDRRLKDLVYTAHLF